MARRGNRRKSTVGPILGGIAVVALASVAVAMIITGGRTGGLSNVAAEVSGGVGRIVSVPVRWVQSAGSSIGSIFGGSPLNAKLKAENAALLEWRDQARAMAERLDSYEKLHGITNEQMPAGFTGRMIGESASMFSRTGLVNMGSKSGIQVNWIVMNQNGLVGRVIAVGADSSRVLLLSDGDSRVPIMGEITRARAIASGDKSPAPRLSHLNTPALMQDGERVMTSGDDGIFPRGIAVGQAGIAPDKQWRVRLASNTMPIDFVRLIPPSNFPPPLEPVTPPPLAAPPIGTSETVGVPSSGAVLGAVLPLAPGSASLPTAATPEAIRAAQSDLLRKTTLQAQEASARTRKLEAERDAAREAARRADAARILAEQRARATPRAQSATVEPAAEPAKSSGASTSSPGTTPAKSENRPSSTKKPDPDSVPISSSAITPKTPQIVEGSN
jgi:rod shape-determining protein MreC